MFEIIFKIWFLIAIIPLTIAQEGWVKFKKFMDKDKNRWDYFPYILLGILVFILIVLLANGYR